MADNESLSAVLSAAIDDMAEHGYDSADRVAYWQARIKAAAERSLLTEREMTRLLGDWLTTVYRKFADKGGAMRLHKGIERYTIDRLRPQLHAEFERRKQASFNLIKLNREQSIAKTEQRFAGWATSIPKGGSDEVRKREVKDNVRKSMSGVAFEDRRVLIDQGHKLTSSLSEIVAVNGGAIAGIWHSHFHQANYNYREDHKEREIASKVKPFVVRGNWALEKGLMKLDGSQYTDDMTKPGEEVFCRCFYEWIFTLGRLREIAPSMLTKKGMEALARAYTKAA